MVGHKKETNDELVLWLGRYIATSLIRSGYGGHKKIHTSIDNGVSSFSFFENDGAWYFFFERDAMKEVHLGSYFIVKSN